MMTRQELPREDLHKHKRKMRRTRPEVRLVALCAVHQCFQVVAEPFLVRLPECLPFLAELMEDPSSEVRQRTKKTILFLEELSGEKMDEYLT
mmetsp:Transcript_8542/g.32158  ORF Transcript_8542/g.32158 Transcript_8542/m.32158 type:complete len:92 (-) Transcript_8542:72-347(-)